MKRTRQTYHDNRKKIPFNQSGVQNFQGEDLNYESRKNYLKNQQKKWLDQQLKEKIERERMEKENELIYEIQSLEINNLRGKMEYEHHAKRKEIDINNKKENFKIAMERIDRLKQEEKERIEAEKREINDILAKGQKQVFEPLHL